MAWLVGCRHVRGVLRVLLSLALAAGAVGYLIAEKRVTLADEGSTTIATTFAPRVGDALLRLGVRISRDDRVLPGIRSSVDGRIEIRRAKDLLVILNGERRRVRSTGYTVGAVLRDLGISSEGAQIDPPLPTRVYGDEDILVNQPAEVTVIHDGQTQPVVTNAATAGGLLRQMGIALGPHDRVEPSIVFYPAAGSTIKIVRVTEAIDRVHSEIPFRRLTQKSDKLEFGLRQLGTAGVAGTRARIFRVTYEDGRVIRRVSVGTEVVKPPVDEVVLLGTRRPVFVSHGGIQQGQATWYSAPGLTAAHRTLPFGTVVRVTDLASGRHVDVVIRDRGPRSPERVIDISDIAFRELAPLWKGVLNVKIEW